MPNRKKLARICAAALAVTAFALVLAAGNAYASGGSDPSIGTIKVVEPCTAAQAHANHGRGALGEHGDAFYRCRETKPGCYVWKFQYDGRPKSGHTWTRQPCPACSPSPSTSASRGPSPSPSASKSASTSTNPGTSASASPPQMTPVAGVLPVTGTTDAIRLLGVAAVLLGAGGLAVYVPRLLRRRQRKPGAS